MIRRLFRGGVGGAPIWEDARETHFLRFLKEFPSEVFSQVRWFGVTGGVWPLRDFKIDAPPVFRLLFLPKTRPSGFSSLS